jgi:hypothetical protein
MTDLTAKNATPATVSVKLLKPHTHAGKACSKDSSINVTLPEAEFLAERDIISKGDLDKVAKALPAAAK